MSDRYSGSIFNPASAARLLGRSVAPNRQAPKPHRSDGEAAHRAFISIAPMRDAIKHCPKEPFSQEVLHQHFLDGGRVQIRVQGSSAEAVESLEG